MVGSTWILYDSSSFLPLTTTFLLFISTVSPAVPMTRLTNGMLPSVGERKAMISPCETERRGRYDRKAGGKFAGNAILSRKKWSPTMIVGFIDSVGTWVAWAIKVVKTKTKMTVNARLSAHSRT